jgi:hypothetical protein
VPTKGEIVAGNLVMARVSLSLNLLRLQVSSHERSTLLTSSSAVEQLVDKSSDHIQTPATMVNRVLISLD